MHKAEFIHQSESVPLIKGFAIDTLDYVSHAGVTHLRVVGWIVAEGRTVEEIVVDSGFRKTRIPTKLIREDVVAAFPNSRVPPHCGFSGTFFIAGLGSSFSLALSAVLASEDNGQSAMIWIGEILGRQPPIVARPLPHAFAPVCLTSYGRSGSTIMMQILNAHPDIFVAGGYPFESRFAHSALDHMARGVQAGLLDRAPYLDIPDMGSECQTEMLKVQTAATVAAIDCFYNFVAGSKPTTKTRLFAEKCPPSFLPNIVHDAYGSAAKEIILVRDPRDIFCSAKAFDEKRGTRVFGSAFETDADWFRHIQAFFVGLARCRVRRTAALVVRYEDLMLDPFATVSKLLCFLDVQHEAAVVSSILAQVFERNEDFDRHATSGTPEKSVARWRALSNHDFFLSGSQEYRQAMQEFSYVSGVSHDKVAQQKNI